MQNSQNSPKNSRKGGRYVKIPLSVKISLLKLVFQDGEPIKSVSEALKIKYSTAKTLARQYKRNKQCIDWNDYQDKAGVKDVKITEPKRCDYIEIEQMEVKSEIKDSQTELLNANGQAIPKMDIQENHSHNLSSSQKIQIISTTIRNSFYVKSAALTK